MDEEMRLPPMWEVDDNTFASFEDILADGELFVQCVRRLTGDASSLVAKGLEKFQLCAYLQASRRSGIFLDT